MHLRESKKLPRALQAAQILSLRLVAADASAAAAHDFVCSRILLILSASVAQRPGPRQWPSAAVPRPSLRLSWRWRRQSHTAKLPPRPPHPAPSSASASLRRCSQRCAPVPRPLPSPVACDNGGRCPARQFYCLVHGIPRSRWHPHGLVCSGMPPCRLPCSRPLPRPRRCAACIVRGDKR